MRVCLVVEAASGATGRHVADLAASLTARGHDIWLVYSPLRADAGFHRFAGNSGARLVSMPMARSTAWSDVAAARALSRLLAEHGPFAVVHAHCAKAGTVTRLAAVGRAALVYTPHALAGFEREQGLAARTLAGLAGRLLRRRTDVSSEPDEAPGRSRREVRSALNARSGEVWLGFAGRLAPRSGALLFVAAATGAMRRFAPVRALVLGDGEQERLVVEAIAESGFGERFLWLRDEPPGDWLAGLDLLVVTSAGGDMPAVLREGLAAGVPVLTTPVRGTAELLAGGAGIVVESEALPGVLLGLVGDRKRLALLRRKVRGAGDGLAPGAIERTEALYAALAGGRA